MSLALCSVLFAIVCSRLVRQSCCTSGRHTKSENLHMYALYRMPVVYVVLFLSLGLGQADIFRNPLRGGTATDPGPITYSPFTSLHPEPAPCLSVQRNLCPSLLSSRTWLRSTFPGYLPALPLALTMPLVLPEHAMLGNSSGEEGEGQRKAPKTDAGKGTNRTLPKAARDKFEKQDREDEQASASGRQPSKGGGSKGGGGGYRR